MSMEKKCQHYTIPRAHNTQKQYNVSVLQDSAKLSVNNPQSCLLWQVDSCLNSCTTDQAQYFQDPSNYFKHHSFCTKETWKYYRDLETYLCWERIPEITIYIYILKKKNKNNKKNTRWGTKVTPLSHRRVKAKCYLGQGSIRTACTTFTRACHKSLHDPNKTTSNHHNPFLGTILLWPSLIRISL